MSAYDVTAIDSVTGRPLTERVEADSDDLARTHLASRGLVVVHVKKVGFELSGNLPFLKPAIKPKDLAVFARQFATMINAGMPMLRGLDIMVKQTSNPSLREVLRSVHGDIEGGSKLSDAIAAHDRVFPPLMISMVRSGEVGGFLDTALLEVANAIEKDVKLHRQIKSAMTYPVAVLIIAVIGVAAMLVFVVPTMTKMFAGLGGTLPLPTRIVVAMSDFMKTAIFPIIGVSVAFSMWWRKNKNEPAVRAVVDPIKLKLPVFGPLVKKIALSRFCRNLSVMLGSGVPILTALKIVADTADNSVVRNAVLATAAKVEGGGNLSDHLGTGGVIPDMVVQMVAVGEESGMTDAMLAKAATFYDDEVEATTEQLAALLEPILIVFVALILGSLVVSMYLPTFAVFNLVN